MPKSPIRPVAFPASTASEATIGLNLFVAVALALCAFFILPAHSLYSQEDPPGNSASGDAEPLADAETSPGQGVAAPDPAAVSPAADHGAVPSEAAPAAVSPDAAAPSVRPEAYEPSDGYHYRPIWTLEGMSPGLESLRGEAEGFSDVSEFRAAADAWGRLAAEAQDTYGPDDPRALAATSREVRALVYLGDAGRSSKAAADHAASGLVRALGQDSPEALYAEETAAGLKLQAGDIQAAEREFASLAVNSEKALGRDHPQTLAARRSLALATAGSNPEAAADALRAVSETAAFALGPEHPETLRARGALAKALTEMGDFPAAREILVRVAESFARTLGADHPDTYRYRDRLAFVLNGMGDREGARDMYGLVLESRRRVLGDDHPDTLKAKEDIAQALTELGDLTEARELYAQVMESRTRTLGVDHPETARSRERLAAAEAAGD
ncbi:MAG: tetratricopeptide repeat protein [Deltaproteobacteria bacterium]|jgi:hypothetical protein|nr:tetratricopeptide repeat protein [Deltaproteobacteria bacterium]